MARFSIRYVDLRGVKQSVEVEAQKEPDLAEASTLLRQLGVGHFQVLAADPLGLQAPYPGASALGPGKHRPGRRKWLLFGAATFVTMLILALLAPTTLSAFNQHFGGSTTPGQQSTTTAPRQASPANDAASMFSRSELTEIPCTVAICGIANPGARFMCTITRYAASCKALKGDALVEGQSATNERGRIPGTDIVEGPANFASIDNTGEASLSYSTEGGPTRDYYVPYDFGYLRTLTSNGFTCVTDASPSEAVGCRHDASGHGFKVSREGFETF